MGFSRGPSRIEEATRALVFLPQSRDSAKLAFRAWITKRIQDRCRACREAMLRFWEEGAESAPSLVVTFAGQRLSRLHGEHSTGQRGHSQLHWRDVTELL